MKTPREILLERHRGAQRSLDAVRLKALAALAADEHAAAVAGRPVWLVGIGLALWRELIWPSRRAWAGLAAIWLAVLAANLGMQAIFGPAPGLQAVPAREVARAMAEQQRLLAELLSAANPASVNPAPVQPAAPSHPRPRSERKTSPKLC